MELLRSLGERAAVTSKAILREAEMALGKLVPGAKMKARAKVRAGIAAKVVAPLLKRERSDGVTPFPSARTRTALRAARGRRVAKVQGER